MMRNCVLVLLVVAGLVGCDSDKKSGEPTHETVNPKESAAKDDTKQVKAIPFDEAKSSDLMESLRSDPKKAGDVIATLVAMGPKAIRKAKFQVLDWNARANAFEADDHDKAGAEAVDRAAVLLVNGMLRTESAHLEDLAKHEDRPLVRAAVCSALKGLGKDCPAKE